MITVPMTTAEAVHVRQALATAIAGNHPVFDDEQVEMLAEVEGRIAEHVDAASARRAAARHLAASVADVFEAFAAAFRSHSEEAS